MDEKIPPCHRRDKMYSKPLVSLSIHEINTLEYLLFPNYFMWLYNKQQFILYSIRIRFLLKTSNPP